MPTQAIVKQDEWTAIEQIVMSGNLGLLTPEQRVRYYKSRCDDLGLSVLAHPFEWITLNGKLTLYALKSCTDQLRVQRDVSIDDLRTEMNTETGIYTVTVVGHDKSGRKDADIGAVHVGALKGEALCNAQMKAATKAKRRFTLSLCGVGMLDETEIESIPASAIQQPIKPTTRKVIEVPPPALPPVPPETGPEPEQHTVSTPGPVITAAQGKRLWTIARERGWKEQELRDLVGRHGFEHSNQITRSAYENICKEVEARNA